MDFNSKLEKFAELIVRTGVNLQSGEELVVSSPIECADFARRLAEEAYKAGAKKAILPSQARILPPIPASTQKKSATFRGPRTPPTKSSTTPA